MLRRYSHKPRKQVVIYLSTLDAYTLHKNRLGFAFHVDERFPGELQISFRQTQSTYNDGYRQLLNCIDVFTKRAWSLPLRTMTGPDVSNALEGTLTEQRCNMVQSDKGTEFLNSMFKSMLLKFYTSENEDIKAAVVERFIKTLKQKMYRYFIAKRTRRYVDVLPDLVQSYNNTHHRSICMASMEVTANNEDVVRSRKQRKRRTLRNRRR